MTWAFKKKSHLHHRVGNSGCNITVMVFHTKDNKTKKCDKEKFKNTWLLSSLSIFTYLVIVFERIKLRLIHGV